jgi:hypothetical protein
VLVAGTLCSIFIMLAFDPATRMYDKHLRERPWVSAGIEIVPSFSEGTKPSILYTVRAPAFVEGTWKAWTQKANNGRRLCGGDGTGTYSPENSITKSWSWEAYFERDCPEPNVPYEICVLYNVRTATGVPDQFGPFCSNPYDPKGKMQ